MRSTLILAAVAAISLGGCHRAAEPPREVAAAVESPAVKAFFAQNARQPGVIVLPSGLQYKIVHSGPATGLHPKPADEVKVNYEGKLVDGPDGMGGKVFDSSYERGQPAAMPLQHLIPGWIEALQLMRPGDEWILYVPPELGYGAEGQGDIPPGSALIFRIELIDFLAAPGSVGQG
jgi:FKBP-type peptidyl-prolyl cis-trans isomerase